MPNGSAEGHILEIGGGQFIDGFEEGVTGMKISDQRTLNLRFPEAYHEQSLAGQPVTFEVTLKGIKKKVLPELNDELAKKVGTYENLDALKTAIRKDIQESEERRIQEETRNRLISALVESNPIEVPQTLGRGTKEGLGGRFQRPPESTRHGRKRIRTIQIDMGRRLRKYRALHGALDILARHFGA